MLFAAIEDNGWNGNLTSCPAATSINVPKHENAEVYQQFHATGNVVGFAV